MVIFFELNTHLYAPLFMPFIRLQLVPLKYFFLTLKKPYEKNFLIFNNEIKAIYVIIPK